MLAGLSGLYILRIPPCFWANSGWVANNAVTKPPVTRITRGLRFILPLPDTVRGRRSCPFSRDFRQNPQLNPAISGPGLGLSFNAPVPGSLPRNPQGGSIAKGAILAQAHSRG